MKEIHIVKELFRILNHINGLREYSDISYEIEQKKQRRLNITTKRLTLDISSKIMPKSVGIVGGLQGIPYHFTVDENEIDIALTINGNRVISDVGKFERTHELCKRLFNETCSDNTAKK